MINKEDNRGISVSEFISQFNCSAYSINEEFDEFEADLKKSLISEYSNNKLTDRIHSGFSNLAEYIEFKIKYRFEFLSKLNELTTLKDGFNGNKKILTCCVETKQNFKHFRKKDISQLLQNIGEASKLMYNCKRDYFNYPLLHKYELIAHNVIYQLCSILSRQDGDFVSISDKIYKLNKARNM